MLADQARQADIQAGFKGREVTLDETRSQREGELQPGKVEEQNLTNQGKKYTLFRTQKSDQQFDQGLAQVPPQMVPFITTGTAAKVNPFDPEGSVEQQRALERIQEQGTQNVRSSQAAAGNAVVPVDTVDEQGNAVRIYVPRSEAVGKTYQKPPTADMRNADVMRGRVGGKIATMREVWKLARPDAKTGLPGKWEAFKASAEGTMGYNDPAAMYNDWRKGAGFEAARLLGSNSQLSDAERAAATASTVPSLSDNPNVAMAKFDFFEALTATEKDPGRQTQVVRDFLGRMRGAGGKRYISTDPNAR
jgi:hypothetical protein